MTSQDKKVANYHPQSELHKTSLWLALAILIVPVVGLGVFLTVANGWRTPPAAITHFASQHQ
jgi:hypothetical protein